jgi:hemoglobin-like flavoprotein
MTSPSQPALTEQQARLVRESIEALEDLAGPMTVLFYGRLFELDPSLRPLFHIDIREQASKLMAMLQTVVASLDHFDQVRPQLAELGSRHVTYHVRPEHYRTLREALLWSLGRALDTQFDRETRAAWTVLLDTISQAMLAGAQPGPAPPPRS